MNIKLDRDTITPELQRLMKDVKRPIVVMQAGAKTVQVELSKHLKRLQSRGNKKGWPTQHFFANGPTSVERRLGVNQVTDTGAIITIADPRFVHRIEGGTVRPKRRQWLAIPLTAAAYALSGKGSIRESMPGLKVWRFKRGLFIVRELGESRGKISRVRVILMFKLVKSVTHSPKPDEKPDEKQLGAAAGKAMERAARLLTNAKDA